jgi:hypothetical protein
MYPARASQSIRNKVELNRSTNGSTSMKQRMPGLSESNNQEENMNPRRMVATIVTAAFLMFVGGSALAQDHHDRDEHHEHQWDREHPRFDDHERGVVTGWCGERHERPIIGFRVEDRLPRDWEPRLQTGFVLDNDWRRRALPVPIELYRRLPPPPHFHYYVLGGHIVLVDQRNWRVADVINIDF